MSAEMTIETVMRLAPVIPVVVIDDPAHARPIAEALVAGGLPAIEVTLRTPAALEAITEIRGVAGAVVGAGTVLDDTQLDQAIGAGAAFAVSPGLTERLGRAAAERGVPFLPGIANASDLMRGFELGLRHFKFFPAVASGGLPTLKSLTGPFGAACFCPTGGITPNNAADWLADPAVICVGGTWIVPRGAPDAESVRSAAARAADLRQAVSQTGRNPQ